MLTYLKSECCHLFNKLISNKKKLQKLSANT